MAVADTHGELIDVRAGLAALDFADYFKPTIRVHLGDGVDLGPLRDRACEREKYQGAKKDLEAATDFNRRYKPTRYLFGNHDFRLHREIKSPNQLRSEHAYIMLQTLYESLGKALVIPYGKRCGVLRIGDTRFVHGYHTGINAARAAAQCYCNGAETLMMGHIHRIDCRKIERHHTAWGMSIGCLCQIDLDYNIAQAGTLAQEHGFAYGWKLPSGTIVWNQARKHGGKWFFPTEMQTYG